MPDSAAAAGVETSLTLLGSVRELDDGELPRLYAYPDQEATWVRANFISSVDGGATTDGKSGSMGGPGDRLIFKLLRGLADVIVVGAGTVRIEGYSGAQLGIAQRQRRQACGQTEIPQLAIVTRSGRLDRDMPVFTRTEVPPLVLTCTAAADETRRLLTDLAEVVDCSGKDPADVDEAAALAMLRARGLHRVLTEGG
ncbi:MAG TPA: pyrimidine reductase family protein, partial [Mycobacterium sp.]